MIRALLQGDSKVLMDWLEHPTPRRIGFFVIVIIVGCGLYGASVGCWRSPLMGVYVGIKLPLLVFLTLACNGVLNGVLGVLLGSGLGFRQSFLALLMSFSVLALLLGALAPVALFFAWNAPGAESEQASIIHSMILLMHTALIGYTGVMANLHLYNYLKSFCPTRRIAFMTLGAWLAGNAFVGAQFSWILRPFFGTPKLEVEFLRENPMEGTFYEAVWRSIQRIQESNGYHILINAAIFAGVITMYLSNYRNHERTHQQSR